MGPTSPFLSSPELLGFSELSFDLDNTSTSSQSFRSTSSSGGPLSVGGVAADNGELPCKKNLFSVPSHPSDSRVKNPLEKMLQNFIIYRCSMNEHCSQNDFDEAALDALLRMPFIQALQTVEHFSASVSPRIQKKSAYLMSILRGQESQWDRYTLSGQPGSFHGPKKGKDLLKMPSQLTMFIGQCCLQGNCLPSDFSPEVCLNLQNLPVHLALKSISAFNSNKRIVAGAKGGIINRARFFVRLIQNVADQNLSQDNYSMAGSMSSFSGADMKVLSPQLSPRSCSTSMDNLVQNFQEGLSFKSGPVNISLGRRTTASSTSEFDNDLNLEQLAELDFNLQESELNENESNIEMMKHKLEQSQRREKQLLYELSQTRKQLFALQNECVRMKSLLGGY